MASDASNCKKLYSFVKDNKSDSSGMAPLKKDGTTHNDATTKSEILNGQYLSAFTTEETISFPDLGASYYPEALEITGDYPYISSVTAMTESLSWETLQHRRQQAKAIMMFCIVHAMVAIPAFPHLQLLGAIGCCYKRPPVQVQSPILQDQYIQRFLLPIKYQTVEPAARKADKCWVPRSLQDRDFSSYTSLDSKMFYPVFSLLLTSLGPLAMYIV